MTLSRRKDHKETTVFKDKPLLVLFDLDGTLVDSVPDLAHCIDLMLKELDREPAGEARVRAWVGNGAEALVRRALTGDMDGDPGNELFQRAFELFSEHYISNSDRSRLYPGVRDGIEHLKRAECRLGCVTNKRGKFTEPLLRALGLYDDFEIVISGDTLPRKKPDPLPLQHAMNSLGVGPDRTLMVGDSRNDVEAARAAGTAVLCVRYGYNHGDDIENACPDRVVDSLAELCDLI